MQANIVMNLMTTIDDREIYEISDNTIYGVFVESCNEIRVKIPARVKHKPVHIQPLTQDLTEVLIITADTYHECLTYKVNHTSSEPTIRLDGPHMLAGKGAVSLLAGSSASLPLPPDTTPLIPLLSNTLLTRLLNTQFSIESWCQELDDWLRDQDQPIQEALKSRITQDQLKLQLLLELFSRVLPQHFILPSTVLYFSNALCQDVNVHILIGRDTLNVGELISCNDKPAKPRFQNQIMRQNRIWER